MCSLRGKRSVPAEMSLGSRNSPAGLLTESVTKTTFTETTVIVGDKMVMMMVTLRMGLN